METSELIGRGGRLVCGHLFCRLPYLLKILYHDLSTSVNYSFYFSHQERGDSIELFRLVFKWRKETGVTASVIPTQVTGQPVLPLPRGDDLQGDDRQTHMWACRASRSGDLVEGKEGHGDERRSGASLALGEAAAAREDACLD